MAMTKRFNKDRIIGLGDLLNKINLKLRPKLILIFLVVKVIPIILLTAIAWTQITSLGRILRDISVGDSSKALNDGARENIERMTTDTATIIAEFLHQRDQDVLLLANLAPSDATYKAFSESRNSMLMRPGEWVLAEDGMSWVEKDPYIYTGPTDVSVNRENNDELYKSAFRYRPPEVFRQYHEYVPLYDEVAFIDLNGNEVYKYVTPGSTKKNYPLNPEKGNVSDKGKTYVKAESYFAELKKLRPGEIYVSDVIGAYVGTNYIGMYTPGILKKNVAATHPNYDLLQEIANMPVEEFIEIARQQAYAGKENPVGKRFEGIVRWATPVTDKRGTIIGYATMALNHDHIMGFVDYITPMFERYTVLPDAYDGNYAFIWDYKCRNIAHPRHHSIVGYNPLTGEPQVPWLEGTIDYERDYKNGGFVKLPDEKGNPTAKIPILDAEGNTQPAKDTPYYHWFTNGGAEWLAANPAWNNLSKTPAGASWGQFLAKNESDRDILPQFGERILKDRDGNSVKDANNNYIFDYQSRDKTPARALTKAGFVGLDGRYLNNAPQCTGWMNLTGKGGSGSFYILWSGIYKPTTAGAIPYYTGQYAPENQNGSKRGFAMVTIGAGIEDFTRPAHETEVKLTEAINHNLLGNTLRLAVTSIFLIILVVLIAILLASYLTGNIKLLLNGISHFRTGERQFRFHSTAKDEFGMLADSFDEMADSIVNSVSSPLVITDMDHKIIYLNDQALKFIGKTMDKSIGTSYNDISVYPPGSKYCPITALHESREAEVLYMEDNGHYLKGIANYLLDKDNNRIGYIIISNDVTEIEEARQKAEQASRAKGDFLSNMSHEIRTPMNAIIGMTSIGKTASDIDKKDYAFRKIQDASTHLLGVINDILDVSKIEAKKLSLSVAAFEFDKMLQRTVDVINFRVDKKHQKLTVHIDPTIPSTLIGDDQRIAQVITNLLSNAVKFTPEGGSIHLEVTLLLKEKDVCTLLIAVSDTGIGISKEQQERLFTSFVQAETSTSRKYGGTGLGLVISKSIVELMNGKIWLDSELGKGATFSFTVPLACGGKEERRMLLNPELNWKNIQMLAIDADPQVLIFFREVAKQLSISCDTVSSGHEALSLIEKNGAYNLYFIDWNMPEMNGIELARIINEQYEGAPAVIMMASVTDWNTIHDSAIEAGVNKFLPKPLFMSYIADSINEYLGVPAQAQGKQEAPVINLEDHCILLAEDVEINQEIVLALLGPTNIKIDCAANGIEALEAFMADPLKYGMIFMDVQMPGMDGYTATRKIRTSGVERAQDIPIVAMTANVFREDIEKCLASGMDGHVGKPLVMEEVIRVLEKYLKKS